MKTKTLSAVAPAVTSDIRFPQDSLIWHLTLDQIASGSGVIENRVYAPAREAGTSTFIFDTRNVLYSKLRPYLNKVICPDSAGVATTELVPLRPNPQKLYREYLCYYLRSPAFVSWVSSQVAGAKMPRVKMKSFWNHEIPLPPLDDQKRIAHLLGKVEGLIAQRKQHLQELDDLLKSVFLEMFGDPVRNEKGWETEPLGKLAKIERGRFSPRPRNDPKFYNGAYPFIQTGDISRSNGRLREYTQTLNELGIKVSKEFDIGTIVIAIVGATIGETAILQIATYAPDSVIGITPRTGYKETESIFIEFLLRFWKPVLRARAPEAARANINIETLRPLPVIWPLENDRKKFAAIVETVESLKTRYQQSLTDLESLYGALSQKAFKGELDLSRIPLPEQKPDKAAQETKTSEAIDESEPAEMTDRFSKLDMAAMSTAEGREQILKQWFGEWLNDTAVAQDLSPDHFWQRARYSALDYQGDDDASLDFSLQDYDQFKQWLFDAIAEGRIEQTRNKIKMAEKVEFGNQIVLKKVR